MFCHNCGTKNDDDALFCENCGTKLRVAAPVAEEATAQVAEEVAPSPAPVPVAEEAEVAPAQNVEEAVSAIEEVEAAPVQAAEEVASVSAPVTVAEEVEAASVQAAEEVAPVSAPVTVAEEVEAAPVQVAEEPAPAPTPVPAPTPAPSVETQPEAEIKAKKPGKKIKPLFVIIPVCSVFLIALIVAAIIFAGRFLGGGNKLAGTYTTWYDPDSDITYISYNGNVFQSYFEGYAYTVSNNADNKITLFMCDDDLYVGTSGLSLASVGENVQYYNVSYDGNVIAYVDFDNDLYTYNVKNGNISYVTGDVSSEPILSPNGKILLFNIEDDGDDILYAYIGKKSYKLARDVNPIGVSNNAKYIYYYDPEKQAVYVSDKNYNTNKIGTEVDGNYLFNNDLSQIMFGTQSGIYASERGGDKVKVSSANGFIIPIDTYVDAAYQYYYGGNSTVMIYNAKSLLQHYYAVDYSDILYLGQGWSADKIIGGVADFTCDSAGKNLYYITSDESLYLIRLGGKNDSIKLAEDVNMYKSALKGNAVYYTDKDSTLYVKKGTGKAKKIADDVENFWITFDGKLLYTTDARDYYHADLYLYISSNKKQLINEDCYMVCTFPNSTYYLSGYDEEKYTYDLYITDKGVNFWNALVGVQ
ncbi:MAG: zinc-ribbon domain-containing protein [Lachnospiraceae bacterium]|nr:zinc-ribbon domain-containing protein [Lachnospiraceae bacterium]